jgi:hypothetical protein
MEIVSKAGVVAGVLSALLGMTGCSTAQSGPCQCPKPVAYDDETLKRISQALRALPPDNVLQQAMEDYESERDELRFCR